MSDVIVTRRTALSLAAVAGAGAVLPSLAKQSGLLASEAGMPLLADAELILLDERIGKKEQAMLGLDPQVKTISLNADLVRQWRDGLSQSVTDTAANGQSGAVLAYTLWDHALVLEGLAREERCASQCAKLPAGLFQTAIG